MGGAALIGGWDRLDHLRCTFEDFINLFKIIMLFSALSLEEDFVSWREQFWPAVCEHFGVEASGDESRWVQGQFVPCIIISLFQTFDFAIVQQLPWDIFYLSLVLPAVFCPAASLKRNYKDKTQDDLLWFTPYWIMSPRVHSLQTVVCFVSQHSAVRAEGAHWHQHEQSVHWRDRPPEELWGPEAVSIVAETNHCNGDRSFTASISPAFMTNSRLGTSDPFCPLVVKKPQP